MKTLFNKSSNGQNEIAELLGFTDKDIKYSKMKQEISTATRDIIKIIGKEAFDKAYNLYKEGSDALVIELIQYPIAIDAYRKYAPNNDVSHTNNGRRMRFDDHEKQAFEWLIERDNQAMERKYYRSVDTLISHLYEEEESWKESDSFKKLSKSLFKTTDEFDDIFPIESRLLLLKLQPGIRQCLDYEILPIIGKENFDKIIKGSEVPDRVLDVVKSACAFYSLAWAMPRLSVQLFPEGILQSYVSDQLTTRGRKPPAKNELAYAKENFERDYKRALVELEGLMKPKPVISKKEEELKFIITSQDKYISL